MPYDLQGVTPSNYPGTFLTEVDAAGNTIRYVIERMCLDFGPATAANCDMSPPKKSEADDGDGAREAGDPPRSVLPPHRPRRRPQQHDDFRASDAALNRSATPREHTMTTPSTHPARRLLAGVMAFLIGFGPMTPMAYAATTKLADGPINVSIKAKPNIVFTLDDSTSMNLDFLPDYVVVNSLTNAATSYCRSATGLTACGSVGSASLPQYTFAEWLPAAVLGAPRTSHSRPGTAVQQLWPPRRSWRRPSTRCSTTRS